MLDKILVGNVVEGESKPGPEQHAEEDLVVAVHTEDDPGVSDRPREGQGQ